MSEPPRRHPDDRRGEDPDGRSGERSGEPPAASAVPDGTDPRGPFGDDAELGRFAPGVPAEALRAYAELAVRVGVNLRPGQGLLLRAPLDAAPLARRVVAAGYRAGAPLVDVEWGDPRLALARLRHAPADTLEHYPGWRAAALEAAAARGDAVITLGGGDPELLAGEDPERVAVLQRTAARHLRPFSERLARLDVPWTVMAVPTVAWARKVFPAQPPAGALARLWREVLHATRVLHPGDAPRGGPHEGTQEGPREGAVARWRAHLERLARRCAHLDARRYRALRFRGPGTDLRVGLADGHRWVGGGETAATGVDFVANLPTEEVFTAPHRERVEGWVVASMPLAYGGRLVEGLRLRFEAGRVVEASADAGEAALRRLLDTDDGAARLGEVALVPHSSPLSRSGVLFYNTLFDENAASHLALGRAYRFTVAGGAELADREAAARGLNDSLAHVDFMIGSDALDVDGVRDDRDDDRGEDLGEEPLMRAGEFVF